MTFSTTAARRGALMAGAATPALILSLTFAGAASAQTAEVASVADVVVTAAGFEQRIAQAPASISVIARDEIEEIRATSIAEILNTVEGVDTGAAVGKTGGQTINIRGLGSDYTLVLIDGRRQNTSGSVTPNGFGETSTSFLPPVSAIERVEVVRGPVATLYGSDAIGGVVNIITRKVGDVWSGSVSSNYTLQGDSDFGDFWGANGYASGPLVADLLGLAVRGSYAERDQASLTYRDVNGDEVDVTGFGRSATSYEIWNLGARLNLTPSPDHDLWLDVDTSSQWYDNAEGQMGTNTTAGGYADFLEFNREQYLLAHNWTLPFGALESTLSRNTTETLGRIIPVGVPGAGGPRQLETTTDLFETKLYSQWRNHTFTVGGQYIDAEMTDGVATGNFTFEQWALFVEDEWRFTDTLALTLGVRYDDHSDFGDQVSPRAYLVWNATPAWTLKGGMSAGYKTPRLEQLTPGINGFGRQGTLPLIGTPTLTPETSIASEVGVYFDNGGPIRANLTLFRNDFEDKIATGVPIANCTFGLDQAQYDAGGYSTTGCADVGFWPGVPTFGQSINVDEVLTQGVEAAGRWRIADDWSLSGNYTYTETEQKSGAQQGLPLSDAPPEHMVNAQLRWQATDRLTAWVRGEYRSERYRGDAAIRAAVGDYEAYSLFHLGGAYDVSDRVTVNATIYNLFDQDFVRLVPYGAPVAYTPEYANNQEPRRLYVSVTATF
ncbi:TonB-dependent receptor domain-containing protein [Brevundimonas sp.]|uniref:TonB-dependent receptor domain-containing protein n=1 Tax=Brevundimonas sp. TaxID=1871086 RepID=UPI003BABD07B